tara:strand:+ start:1877 stop:2851 length:975 start_codon:yes stop_codon:yes gene_type:complete
MAHFQGGNTVNFVAGGAQANQFWVPEIYSKKVQLALRKASTVEAICNTDYMGEIKSFGDTVNIVKEPEMSVAAYTRGLTPLVNTALTDEELVLIIDKANYFHFQIDSLEKRFGHINFQEIASNNAAYKLKDTMDSEVMANMYAEAHAATATLTPIIAAGNAAKKLLFGSVAVPIAINHGTGALDVDPLNFMSRCAQVMDENNNPDEGRWFVAAPNFYNSLADTNSKLLSIDYNAGKGSLRNGLVASGLVRGFQMYKSNNLPASAGTTPVVLFGHMRSTSAASAMNTVESFRSPTTFADEVRGLHVYGRKVLTTASIGAGIVTVT